MVRLRRHPVAVSWARVGDTTVGESSQQVVRDVTISNREGFHSRPVMKFVDVAQRFVADIRVVSLTKEDETVDGKSAMELMLLGAVKGTRLRITARGPDAEEAASALIALVRDHFDIDYDAEPSGS